MPRACDSLRELFGETESGRLLDEARERTPEAEQALQRALELREATYGLTVAAVDDLRRRMRSAGATYKVAKNRLAIRALDGTSFQGIAPLLKGPSTTA